MQEIDTSKLHKTTDTLLRLALMGGWTATQDVTGGIKIHSPEHGQTITLPKKDGLNADVRRAWVRKIMRYADPMKRTLIEAHMGEFERQQVTGKAPRIQPADGPMYGDTGAPIVVPDPPVAEPKRAKPTPPKEPERTILNYRPWIAKRRTTSESGEAYPSRAVIERVWSDGTTDYVCAKPGCEYSGAIPNPVAVHYARSKDHPPVPKVTSADVLRTEPYTPNHRDTTQARIDKLARELKLAMEKVTDGDPDELARIIIERRVVERGEDDTPREPLTPEQVIERIRRLVDDGTYLKSLESAQAAEVELASARKQAEDAVAMLADQRRQVEEYEKSCSEWEALASEATAEATRYRERWEAFTALVQEQGT